MGSTPRALRSLPIAPSAELVANHGEFPTSAEIDILNSMIVNAWRRSMVQLGAAPMSLLILLVFLIGAALGMKFKVLILIPAIGFALIAVVAGGIAYGDSVSAILIAAVLASSSLQIGYLCGTVMRYSIVPARIRRAQGLAAS